MLSFFILPFDPLFKSLPLKSWKAFCNILCYLQSPGEVYHAKCLKSAAISIKPWTCQLWNSFLIFQWHKIPRGLLICYCPLWSRSCWCLRQGNAMHSLLIIYLMLHHKLLLVCQSNLCQSSLITYMWTTLYKVTSKRNYVELFSLEIFRSSNQPPIALINVLRNLWILHVCL